MSTAALDQWLNRIAPPGSDNYYALLTLDPERQKAINIILAVFDNIMTMPFVISEDEIVRTKLRWWKEEIIKTQQQHGSHPLSIALAPVMEKYQLNYNALLQSISAIEDIVQNCQFPTEQALRDFYTYTYGIRERMIAKIILPEAKQYSEAIHHIAYCLGLIDNLKHIRQRTAKMYVFFTDEEASELNVDKNSVLTMKVSEPLKKLFQSHIDKAKKHFQMGIDLLGRLDPAVDAAGRRPQASKKHLLPLILRTYLGLQWCDLISEEQFPLFTHQVELTPIQKWWHCRKYKKSMI